MLKEWIILFLLISLTVVAAIKGKRSKAKQPTNKFRFYLKDIIGSIILLLIFLVLKPSIYYKLDFLNIDKGIIISEEVLSVIIPIFIVPFGLSFTRWSNNYPKDITSTTELFGYPISYLPITIREYLLFVGYIIVGVIFEELICRQFIFYSLNTTIGLSGDILVIASALFFAVGHLYQGWKGILSNLVLGLILCKIFLLKETLTYPIVLHLFLNLTIAVLAFRRMKDLKRTTNKMQTLN